MRTFNRNFADDTKNVTRNVIWNATTVLLLLAVALGSTSALADRDRDRNRSWGNRSYDRDRSNVSINLNVGRPYYGNYFGNSGYGNYGYRNYGYGNHGNFRSRSYRPNTFWNYGIGVGVGSYGSQIFINSGGFPYSRWDSYYDRRPVVVEKNIYIERSTPENRVTTRAISTSTISLFRDRYGRCYERERDSFGNETRIELDPAECDF